MQPNKINMNEMDYGRWMKKKWKKKMNGMNEKKKKKEIKTNNMNNNEVWIHGNEVKN